MKSYQAEVFSRALQTWRPISTYVEPRTFKQAVADCQWCRDNDKGNPKSKVRVVLIEEFEPNPKVVWELPK